MQPNVKYELQELERLIESVRKNAGSDEERDNLETIGKEVERIKHTLVHEVFTFGDERHLERYIQYHQQALIRLMDRAAALLNGEGTEDTRQKKFYRIYYNGLEELLSFVERHFTKYFDQDAKAPEGYLSIARKDTRTHIRKLQKGLTDANADQRLTNLVIHVLKKIRDSHSDKHLTYRKVMYAKEIQKELFRLLERLPQVLDINEELRQIMYYLNYNSTQVLTYHAHYITALLDESETRAEKIEKLSFMLKTINQSQVKPGIRYNQHGPSLKDQLNNYLSEEIDYQERLHQLSGNSPDKPSDPFLQGFKLKFEASVSQLAYLLRIFIETKIILNNNLSQMLHFMAKFAITKRSETISYGSLRSKFYSVESGTKESVRSMLLGMINYIDRN